MSGSAHIPVLLAEAVAALGEVRGQWVADGTLGGGGHTRALLAAGAKVLATDWDARAIAAAQAWAGAYGERLELHHAAYSALPTLLGPRRPQGILLDLGFSSDQLDDPHRGLSYHHAGPLDMRLDSTQRLTAADLLNRWREEQLADLFYHHAEEPKARPLARAVVTTRKTKPYATTTDLLATIEQLYPPRLGLKRAHPAARIFQALRVAVNDELTVLEQALHGCAQQLAMGGTLAVITFQPNEERLVKQVFRALCADTLDAVGRV
ncbi:MAG: 16S rRNA (cytosine(1402)-N(4))-methyltransferase RsmH, partial [Alphaproteobacteria bacterium]|nr:16S rRNA (cytosine(1402)-N(4))-methyltransferase RsmH [Alphaproteobacteria bacterium]